MLFLCKLGSKLELALEFSKEGNEPFLFRRFGTPNILDLLQRELCWHLGHEVFVGVHGGQFAVVVALLLAEDILLESIVWDSKIFIKKALRGDHQQWLHTLGSGSSWHQSKS